MRDYLAGWIECTVWAGGLEHRKTKWNHIDSVHDLAIFPAGSMNRGGFQPMTLRTVITMMGVTLILTSGCQSVSNPLESFFPFSKPAKKEEYFIPPATDKRFSEPPTYPEHTLKPVIRQRGGIFETSKERPQMMSSPGMIGPGMGQGY